MKIHKQVLSRICAAALAALLAVPVVTAPVEGQAAAKPKLAKKKVTVKKGKKVKLTIKGKKIKKTTWRVKNKKIASLSKKKKNSVTIKGVKIGNTKVTAKTRVGKKKYTLTATIKVTGKSTPGSTSTPAAPSQTAGSAAPNATTPAAPANKVSVSLDKTECTVKYMKSVKLTADVKGSSEAVVWTSTDTSVATVKDGLVTAIGEDGAKAVITATAGGESASCTVTVEKCALNTDVVSDNYNDGVSHFTTQRAASTEPTVLVADGGYDGKCFKVTERSSTAQGALVDMTDIAEPGATYEVSMYVKAENIKNENLTLLLSSQTQSTEKSDRSFAGLAAITKDKKNYGGAAAVTVGNPTEWSLLTTKITAPDDMFSYGVYLETQLDASCDLLLDNVTIKLVDRNTPDYGIKSLKEEYAGIFDHFGCGAGFDSFIGENGSSFLIDQFNSYTPGNCYKPDAILGSQINKLTLDEAKDQGYYIPENYASFADNNNTVPALDYTRVDMVLEQAHKLGIKVRAHTLVWHQQTPIFFFKEKFKSATGAKNASKEAMDSRLDYFITNEMNHILAKDLELAGGDKSKCAVYAWDVVNEYLHSHDAMNPDVNSNGLTFYEEIYGKDENGNYLYTSENGMSTTPSYVKYAFKVAHDVLVANGREDIDLVYNDYNTYDPKITDNMIALVNYINAKDDLNPEGSELCEAVGMQSHLDYPSEFHSVANFKTAVDKFVAAGFKIQVTELDATISKNTTDEEHAQYYKDIMQILIDNSKNVTGVTLWSLYDGVSWRSDKSPCVFKGLYNPKAAFHALIEAAEAAKAK